MSDFWQTELTREPIVEGLFYPDDPDQLRNSIETNISRAETVAAAPSAIIVPNASMDFISRHCAEAYKHCSGNNYGRIVMLSASRGGGGEEFHLSESTQFRTPLGSSDLDIEAMEILLSSATNARVSEIIHLQEHAIEIQLPWVQYMFPRVPIVPIITNAHSGIGVKALASALHVLELETEVPTLYIASINLSPALPHTLAAKQAGLFSSSILSGNWEQMLDFHRRGEIACEGVGCAAVLSLLNHRRCRVEILSKGSSFDYDNNDSSVVEYKSISYDYAPNNEDSH